MKKILFSINLIISILYLSNGQRIYPEDFKSKDLIFPENDKVRAYEYNLIDAKVLTKEEITLYIKKQGIHLTYDDCCKTYSEIDVWDEMKSDSDLKEIYSNAKYNTDSNQITYKFPIQKIENRGYEVYHKLWVINKANPNIKLKINYVDNTIDSEEYNLGNNKKVFVTIRITCTSTTNNEYINKVSVKINDGGYRPQEELKGAISSITFENQGETYSPSIALHWTYYKITIANSNFSLKGNSLCDKVSNPCISGYYCIGGVCKKCHPSCFDCVNGGLSTDCSSRCNSHSALMSPDKGSCTLGYIDLNQFEDFDIEDIIPPPRNNRLTISFWMYVNGFPQTFVDATLNNTFSENIDFNFKFETNYLKITCGKNEGNAMNSNALNSWFYTKCAVSFDNEDDKQNYLYIKYFDKTNFNYIIKSNNAKSLNRTNCGHDFKKYYEPDDYISLHFYKFNKLNHDEHTCNVYMKQLVIFREFLPEPYDNKYFSVEKLLTSTLELPEVLFIIPFDELKKESNKYKIKCYSYPQNIEENEIIISPREGSDFNLHPPKLFKRLNLLEKNKKYLSTDLLEIGDITINEENTLLASYEGVPLSCADNFFLYYDIASTETDPTTYKGSCSENCPSDYTMVFGLGDRKGFCNKKCVPTLNEKSCLNLKDDLLHLKTKFECSNNYYNLFYKCETKVNKENNTFYYDPHYTPANIIMDVRHYNLKSYIIEFWYHYSDCGRITSGYIFYSNQIQIKKVESSYNIYTTAHDVRGNITIDESYWNHIIIEVYYDPREERNNKTKVYIQLEYNSETPLEVDHSENSYPLDYIYFCNGRRSSCNNIEISWFCGYYKNLRLFNGVLSQRHIIFRYDYFYSDMKYLLLSSIVLYYPLYDDYISNNTLSQYQNKLPPLLTTSTTNNWIFPQYNYCKKEYETKNYECPTNQYLAKTISNDNDKITECSSKENKVLKLPLDYILNIEIPDYNPGVTLSFYIKIYGFKTTGKIDIIKLGDNLKLSYNSNFDDIYFGLNLVSFTGEAESSENVISNYYNFRKHFGLWTFISVSTFNKIYDSFFPPMVRFEINNKKMSIVGPLDYLNITKLSFSTQIFALVQRIIIYNRYIIGTNAFETTNSDLTTDDPDLKIEKYIEPTKNCNIKNGVIDSSQCVNDNDFELLRENIDLGKYYPFINESIRDNIMDCSIQNYLCIDGTDYNLSCNYNNSEKKVFIGNVSDHHCKSFKYFNFAKATASKTLSTIGSENKFTLHFWVFAYSYVVNVFKGLEVKWEDHLTIKVERDTNNIYNFECIINGQSKKKMEFYMNTWNYLHCAVNKEADVMKFYMTTEDDYYSDNIINFSSGTSNIFSIKDLTEVKDWGVLFYKDIRLWKDAFQYSSFLSRVDINQNRIKYCSEHLLYQYETYFIPNSKTMKDTCQQDTDGLTIKYPEYPNGKIGTNIIPEDIYKDVNENPIKCYNEAEYYDRKTTKCTTFKDTSNIVEDIIIEKVDVAYSHNYGIAFWILLEEHKDIIVPLNFIWQYHMQISLQYDKDNSKFKAYCFPQNYFPYSKTIADSSLSLEVKTSQVLNSVTNTYSGDLGGVWTWIHCSLSYNNRLFYLNENQKTLIAETLYKYEGVEYKNDEPLGYFYNKMTPYLSTLEIQITGNRDRENNDHKKIYLRSFYLFRDYLPYNYNFKYMNMYQIGREEFPPLSLAIDFNVNNENKSLLFFKYKIYSTFEELFFTSETKNYTIYDNSDNELSENFIFLPLCDPLSDEKYDEEKQLCQEIDNCDKISLNCLYCMEENTPLICKNHYYINIDSQKEKVECLNYCQGNYYRSPGTAPNQGICGTDCISFDILKTCPNTAASILTYQNDFACLTGYSRIGYQCFNLVEEPNPGALFYSGINYPYNIYQSFSNDFISLIGNGYVLEFWFMIDNVIYNSSIFQINEKYHYFYSKPHEIYVQKSDINSLKYVYLFSPGGSEPDHYEDLTTLIHQYEWNKILIFVDATISGIKEIRVVVNFDKKNTIKFDVNGGLNLAFIAFCSTDPNEDNTGFFNAPECVSRGKPINWASAYYNNIRIWNIKTSTIDIIQSYINVIFTENPQSIILFYPLKIQYLDNNIMTNIMGNLEEHFVFKNEQRYTLYNKDNIIIYNYSSKFDWGLLHPYQFVNNMDGDYTMVINPGTCDENCIRCYEENNIQNCYECKEGYVLQYKECRKADEFYFLKTPSGMVGGYINLAIEDENGNSFTDLSSFTIVFWIKFFGVEYSTVTEYCRILTLDSNTYLAFHRTTNDIVMLENSKIVFRDTNFNKYFGIWIPISIANYISNAQSDIYPNMFTLSVNKIDIPFSEGYSIPSTGIKVTQLQLGYEIIALFAELSIYSKFIQGGYGKIRSTEYLKDRCYYKTLTGTSTSNCIDSSDLISQVPIICAPDYNVNFMEEYFCNNDKKFYNPYDSNNDEIFPNEDKCGDCDSLCNTLCFLGGTEECTCDMTDGIFWLRRNVKMQTFCEHIPYFDFSNIKPYTFTNTPMSKTKEYTIEFWFFVYSYNTVVMNFKTLWIEWNYHNRLKLYNEQNSLKVDCQPIWRSHDFDIITYPDNRQGSLKYYQWNYVKCGTDLKNKKYFLNTITEYALKAKEEYFFDLREIDSTATEDLKYFSIFRSDDFLDNFGYIFIRELKLWQQYNLDFLDLNYIYFDLDKTSVDDLKKDFPGLLLYYKNEFNLNEDNNPVITEILTGTSTIIGRDPEYVGYNIVDPENKGYAPLLVICPYGQVYNDLLLEKCECPPDTEYNADTQTCDPVGDEEYEVCRVYSNSEKQCLTCKDDTLYLNKWITEFEEKCYYDCPATLFEDPLMNQCRRCHETCYECTNENYNNCTSCTGELYFNFKENTCIPNCQAAGLTRSLTRPNICVVFDADASLVNVNTLTPIDVNTFDYIEAIVIQPTSTEYQTLWLFDANKTNEINRELGFDDEIPLTSSPFVGDKTRLRAELDHTFFKTKHKYVFGLKIYVENEGLEVPVYVWWTLTMNAPPFGGQVTVMPYLGLYNTTTFIMRCVDWLDENTPTEEIEYDFYYIEVNTNSKIKLSRDFSLNNEVYSNFTVRYYQLEYSNITIYCQARDKYGAIGEASNVITIVNQKNSPLYNLKQIVSSFYIVDDALTDIQLLARAEVLMSLGINPYTERVPSSFFTTYAASLTGEKVEQKDPQCITGYCNENGDCEVIDVALTCKCVASYIGKECFLDKDGYTDLAYYYKKLYQRLIDRLTLGSVTGDPINDNIFNAFYKLFFAAQNFFQEDSYFETNLIEFKSYLKERVSYITANEDRVNKIMDLNEFFYNYYYIKETKLKLANKVEENYPFRNKTLTLSEYSSYKTSFQILINQIDEDSVFLIQNYGKDYDYENQHFIYHLKKIDEKFDDESYFESLKTVYVTYKPVILFMNCLKERSPTFNYFFSYVEYLVNPLSYESIYYPNITSPFISIKLYDLNGNQIPIRNCPSYSPIKIYLPFNSYDWMNYINEQKWLFLPENYKLENDPVFRDPILIWENGTISNDTVDQRIEKYYRYYNIVGLVHTPSSLSLYEYTTLIFKNISDSFLLMFESNHLSSFTSMIIPNIMNFVVDGRFYYLPRYKVLFCLENHINNPAFYIWASLLFLFISISIFYKFYDYNYFDRLEELNFLQKEIIKVHFPYKQLDPGLNDENIFNLIPKESKLKKTKKRLVKNMFRGYNMKDNLKENEENEEEEENDNEFYFNMDKYSKKFDLRTDTNNDNDKDKPSTRRILMSRNDTKSNNEEEDIKEKATEIRTSKKHKSSSKKKGKKENDKKNPPKKRHKKYSDDEEDEEEQKYTLPNQFKNKRRESSKNKNNDSFDLKDLNKTDLKKPKNSNSKKKEKEKENEKEIEDVKMEGYGVDEEDFNENKIQDLMKSEKNSIKTFSKGVKQNYDLQTLNSKYGMNNSKLTKSSRRSKKTEYFYGKDKTKANYISFQRFHNKAGRINVDNDGIPLDIINEEEERKKALEAYTRLSVSPLQFFTYNLKVRHILIAPFLNLTLFNNRWKKLMVLLTQFYIQQLIISLILTYKESIILSNILGIIMTSLIAAVASDLLVYCFVFLFETSTYQRKRLYRLVMLGEGLIVEKAWGRLKRIMNFSLLFGFIIALAFWAVNLYITLIFTAVWGVQRSAWVLAFFLALFFDLVVGEFLIEGICAYSYSQRVKSNFYKRFGESLNRLRCYRTLWP